jgi:glycine oxidase
VDRQHTPALSVPDVLVVGAGIIGCAVGEALGRAGASVEFVEPRGVGFGATHASAGMLTPYKEGLHNPVLEALGLRSLWLWDAFVGRLFEGGVSSQVYSRQGSLDLALDDAEAEALQAVADTHAARGIGTRYLKGVDAKQIERDIAADCVGALLTPAHGYANASAVTAALWRACAARGARLTQAAVERIEADGASVAVHTTAGTLLAPTVVLAAGSWAGRIVIDGNALLPVHPVRGQLLHLQWPEPRLTHIVWGSRCYAVPWPDGTLLVGATLEEVGFDDRATVAGVRDLLDSVSELVPRAWQAGFLGARVGLRPASPDTLPIIGRSSRVPGLVYATGHYRNGVLLAPLTAELVARIVSGDETDAALAVVSPGRFGRY